MTSYVAFGLILVLTNLHLCVSDSSLAEQFEDIYDYVLGLRETTDNMRTYLTQIQKIFCPEQPICDEERNHGSNNGTLPLENLYTRNKSLLIEDLKYLVGVCCLPCSCSDRCSEDDNCCLSKDVARVSIGEVRSDCTAPTAEMYMYQRSYPAYYPMYFMITHCFRNDTNMATISKCESPDQYVLGDTIPVTSPKTGRTYWNKHCAICNADVDDVLPWNSTVVFDTFLLHSPLMTSHQLIPQSPEEFYTYLRKKLRASIIYTPPLPMQHKQCTSHYLTCTDQGKELANENDRQSFLYDACIQYSSQVRVGYPRARSYKNIFCFFCRKKYSSSRTSCDSDAGERFPPGKISGLINYRKSSEADREVQSISGLAGSLRGNCACYQVYDTHRANAMWMKSFTYMSCKSIRLLETIVSYSKTMTAYLQYGKELFANWSCHTPLTGVLGPDPYPIGQPWDILGWQGVCRDLYCPPGEFLEMCQCVKLINNITGMQMFLRLKVEPPTGLPLPTSDAKRRKMRISLRKLLKSTSAGNDADILATFRNTDIDSPYYFVIATVTSTAGNDIKEATKPFLAHFDDLESMEILFDKTTFMVTLTSKVQFGAETDENYNMYLTAQETNGKTELEAIYIKDSLRKPTQFMGSIRQGVYQLLSPILFCSQVQLDGNEFQEMNGAIQINTTTLKDPVYDYIRIDDTHVRVCVDQYLQKPMVSLGTGLKLHTMYLLVLGILYGYNLVPCHM